MQSDRKAGHGLGVEGKIKGGVDTQGLSPSCTSVFWVDTGFRVSKLFCVFLRKNRDICCRHPTKSLDAPA